jgi:hypothetical protein
LTRSRTRGYGSRPPVRLRHLPVLVLALAACNESQYARPPPTDRFTFPLGLAVHRLPGGGTALLVASTNTDLSYDASSGGTLMSVDPAAVVGRSGATLRQLGLVRMPSFGGPIAVAEDDPASCPGIASPRAILGTRYSDDVVLADLGPAGELACPAEGCARLLAGGAIDPYGVAIACRGTRREAVVAYLQGTPLVALVDLAARVVRVRYGLIARPYDVAYDAERDRLWITEHAVGSAPLEAVELGPGCTPELPGCDVRRTLDLWPVLPGLELAGIALAHDLPGQPRRAYIAGRVYDVAVAASIGGRPSYDVGAALLVVDLPEGPLGFPSAPLVRRIVPLAIGASQVRVLSARPGRRDVVVVTSTNEGVVTLYDDEAGAVAKVFARAESADPALNPAGAPLGTPLVGKQPIGLAVEPRSGRDWIYVSAFESAAVTAISVDPAAPSDARIEWTQTGVAQ